MIGAETGAEVARQSRPTAPTPLSLSTRINDFFALGENQRSAYANMFGSSLLFFGAIQMMITHGLWLRTEYGLGAVQLGTVALVMGVSDLCGSVGVSLFADRVGKRRSVMVGAMGALLGYLMMPFLDTSVYAAVFSLAFARGTFEYGIVSNISLLSEQVPAQRGKVFTLAGALNLLVGATAGATGPWIYQTVGVSGLAAVSTVATIICLLIYWGWVRESKSVA